MNINCWSDLDSSLFYSRKIRWAVNRPVVYDSIVDFEESDMAFVKIICKNANGKKKYIIDLKAKREQIPMDQLRLNTFKWKGFCKVYNDKGRRIKKLKFSETTLLEIIEKRKKFALSN
jgi:hypothetical protein